jgi:hypothetical protein
MEEAEEAGRGRRVLVIIMFDDPDSRPTSAVTVPSPRPLM